MLHYSVDTNRTQFLECTFKITGWSEFSVTSDPLDTGRYNRFNEKEKKEREKEAENWIPAVSKSGLKVAGRNPGLLHRLSKGKLFCTSTLCIKRIRIS